MALVITDDKHYKNIADKIRTLTGLTTTFKPVEITNGIDDIYHIANKEGEDYGYNQGKSEGYNEGYRAYYDLFWNTFQRWDEATQTTKRTDYRRAFAYWYLADTVFKPKYDVVPEGDASYMFWNFRTSANLTNITNMDGKKINFDFSKVTNFSYMFDTSLVTNAGTIDCSSTTSLNNAFINATSLHTIERLIVHEGITTYTYCFANTSTLTKVMVEGTIAGTGIVLSAHTGLSHDSIMSFINALKDYSGTSTTKTITFGTTNLAKLTNTEKAIATQKGWTLA